MGVYDFARFRDFLAALITKEVSFGAGGIRIYSASEIENAQVGYSVTPQGRSLCGNGKGKWRSAWTVIGEEIGLGDPIFVDTVDPNLAVFTAIHGEGDWNPNRIAVSIDAFTNILREFASIAAGRSNPAAAEDNPTSEEEKQAFLLRVAEINGEKSAAAFWEDLFGYVMD